MEGQLDPPCIMQTSTAFWASKVLRTGQPQNEVKHQGKPIFEQLYASEAKLGEFLAAMTGFQAGNFMQLAD